MLLQTLVLLVLLLMLLMGGWATDPICVGKFAAGACGCPVALYL
jgi:hypothetical protein